MTPKFEGGGKRDVSIDILKGLCIILVVIGHLYENSMDLRQSPAYSIIYTFHMPFFMVLSGMVTQYSLRVAVTYHNILQYIWKKFRSLMLPCMMWVLAFSYFFMNVWHPLDIKEYWLGISSHYWYMPCLFLLYVYLFISMLVCSRMVKWKECIVSLLVIVLSFIGGVCVKDEVFRISMSYSLFFIIGYLLSCKQVMKNLVEKQWVIGISLILFCLVAGFYSKVVPDDMINKLSRLLSGILAIPVLLYLGKQITNHKVVGFFSFIGRHTLSIYMLHYAFRNVPSFAVLSGDNLLLQMMVFGIYAVAICYACIGIERLFSASVITGFLFFGKTK